MISNFTFGRARQYRILLSVDQDADIAIYFL